MTVIDALTAQLTAADVLWGVAARPANAGGKPVVVIWPDGPVRTAATLADGRGEQTTVLVCHCLGLTPESAEIAERRLADAVYALYGAVIDGQSVTYPVQDWAQPMVRDDDTDPPLYDLAVEWRLRTRPAT